jgi:hypothetical protein
MIGGEPGKTALFPGEGGWDIPPERLPRRFVISGAITAIGMGGGDPGVGPRTLRLGLSLTTETWWDEADNRRSSVKRVNSRIDKLLGFERHSIRGQRKMKVRMGLGLAVMLAMALGRIEAGQPEQMRSVTLPVCRAA